MEVIIECKGHVLYIVDMLQVPWYVSSEDHVLLGKMRAWLVD